MRLEIKGGRTTSYRAGARAPAQDDSPTPKKVTKLEGPLNFFSSRGISVIGGSFESSHDSPDGKNLRFPRKIRRTTPTPSTSPASPVVWGRGFCGSSCQVTTLHKLNTRMKQKSSELCETMVNGANYVMTGIVIETINIEMNSFRCARGQSNH